MPTNINCIHNDCFRWCKNKAVKKSLFGYGARCCAETNSRNRCSFKVEHERMPPPSNDSRKEARGANEWRPADTAPMNKWILGYRKAMGVVTVVRRGEDRWMQSYAGQECVTECGCSGFWCYGVDYWMPLPEPPVEQAEASK